MCGYEAEKCLFKTLRLFDLYYYHDHIGTQREVFYYTMTTYIHNFHSISLMAVIQWDYQNWNTDSCTGSQWLSADSSSRSISLGCCSFSIWMLPPLPLHPPPPHSTCTCNKNVLNSRKSLGSCMHAEAAAALNGFFTCSRNSFQPSCWSGLSVHSLQEPTGCRVYTLDSCMTWTAMNVPIELRWSMICAERCHNTSPLHLARKARTAWH